MKTITVKATGEVITTMALETRIGAILMAKKLTPWQVTITETPSFKRDSSANKEIFDYGKSMGDPSPRPDFF